MPRWNKIYRLTYNAKNRFHFLGDVVKSSEATESDLTTCIYGASRFGRDAYRLLEWLLDDQCYIAEASGKTVPHHTDTPRKCLHDYRPTGYVADLALLGRQPSPALPGPVVTQTDN